MNTPIRYVLDASERLSDEQFAYLLLTPIFAIVLVIAIWPLTRTFHMSLHSDAITSPTLIGSFVGIENYIDLITGRRDSYLNRPFLNLSTPTQGALPVTFIFMIVTSIFATILGLAAALVLNKEFKGRFLARAAILLPWATPIAIQGMIFYLLFQDGFGILVDPLQSIGVISSAPLANSRDTLLVAIIADVWKFIPFMALLILAGLQSINPTYYKVARISGATRWQQFRYITLPLILPSLFVALLFKILGGLKVYGLFETVSTGGCDTLTSLSCLVVITFQNSRYGTSAAVGFLMAAVVGITIAMYVWIARRYLPKGYSPI